MAKQLGITVDEAVANFDRQEKLLSFVEPLYTGSEDFVDYRGPFGEGALLIMEPGSAISKLRRHAPDELVIREAALTEEERAEAQAALESAGTATVGADFIGVTYDAFENVYTVWVANDTGESTTDRIKASTEDLGLEFELHVRESEPY